jgi:hypothetical protein
MVSDGIKAVQTLARYSPLISSTPTPSTFAKKSILSAVNQVAGRVNHHRACRRPLGRHAAPGRTLLGRNVPRLPAPAPSAPSLS